MARSSACAGGSCRASVWLPARGRTSPPALTTTGTTGPAPRSRARSASSSARSMGRATLPDIASSASFVAMGRRLGVKNSERQAPRGKGKAPPPPLVKAEGPMRVAKAIAHAGLCSRRDAEALIAAGRVAVNGKVLTTPAHVVSPGDKITVDGNPLPQPEATRLWRYNKPRGQVTSHKDPQGRQTVFA